MTKSQLIERVAQKCGTTKKQTAAIVDTLFEEMTQAMVEGETLTLSGFGNFTVRDVAAHKARNPKTNQEITAPASRRAVFSAGTVLKGKINET